MSTGFAGSRSMDERRRRRLASESSESLDDSNEDSTSQTISRTNRFKAGQYPLRTIIFPKRWKLALYYLPVFLCFSGLIAADFYRSEFCTPDSALSGYLSLKQSPLPLYLTGCLLFVSGQISLLIASLRTQSLHDFSGRYRLWKWVAGGLFLFALCTTTKLHHVWATTVIELRLFDWGPHTPLLAWLVPGLALGLSVSLMTYLEMRGDRAGLNFTIIAVAAYVANLTFMFTGNLIPWEAQHYLIGAGLLYFAHWSLFTSLLFHTHHLLYRSVDLPEKVPSRLKQHAAKYLHRRRIKKKARRVAKAIIQKERLAVRLAQQQAKETAVIAADAAKKSKIVKAAAERSTPPAKSPVVETAETRPAKSSEPVAVNKSAPAQPAPEQPSKVEKKTIRVDSAHDPELLKGLSKRERKKLQKQWRDEERLSGIQNDEDDA
ncbi:hypothetical protein [uncultured Gimesia sp.]|uniref:hypothetical protein n=1 Tax=uncultured Gimesia sp. TaxID=1678688 RepID=UPI0026021A97|nr:hypothetical protein [uncultured Gimesia sp.]